MLKLSIPHSITSAIVSSMSSIIVEVHLLEKTHMKLKQHIEKIDMKNAKKQGITLEEYRKKYSSFNKFESIEKLMQSFNKEKETKIFSIKNNEEGLCISVNDQYIVECIETATHTLKRLITPLADACIILDEEVERTAPLMEKWQEEPIAIEPDEVSIDTIQLFVKEEKGPFAILWDFDNNFEYIGVIATHKRNKKEINIQINELIDIVMLYKTNTSIEELVNTFNLPYGLIKAIVSYYDAE